MNVKKFTGKFFAVCCAAALASAVFSACEDKKTEPEQPADDPSAVTLESDLDMSPATEAEILKVVAFLPDPVATVDGEAIPKKEIIDDLVSQQVPIAIFESIGEPRLREAMTRQIDGMVKDRLMLKMAADAGFKPSAEFIVQEMKTEFEELPKEEQDEIVEDLKEHGLTLEEHMKKVSQDTEIQKAAILSKFVHTTFLDKAKKEVSDDDVKKFYEDHLEVLTTPEGVTVAHILAQVDNPDSDEEYAEAKKKIDAIYDEIVKDPSQFGKIASEKSDCPSKAEEGKLPPFDKDGMMLDGNGAMDRTFATAAFEIEKEGQITKPVKTQFGYHIIKLLERTPEEVTPLEKVSESITKHLAEEKAQSELNKALDEAIEKRVKFNDFAPAKDDEDKKD